MAPPGFRLCLLLTRAACAHPPLEVLEAAIAGGVDCVQLREKDARESALWTWGRELMQACDLLQVPLVVNDNVEAALALGARGVHLGQDDMHPDDARALLGRERWIGWSTHSLEQLDEAADLEVDYAGFGPVFATPTKGYERGLGPDHLAAALAIARVPVVAIGGITPENAWLVPEQAAIAVSSAICTAADPQAAAAALRASRAAPAP
ncbi:MAG: thiamine phosphate synthase [Planctomycetota bacterium]|nr:MAG: thiamine phosphate synthase [Planctomycetota bacterium]